MTAFPAPGHQLGRYVLGRQLGQSGPAAVFDATDSVLNRAVGLTVVLAGAPAPADLRNRLGREAATIARGTGLGLQILDVLEAGPAVCLVTVPVPASAVQPWLGGLGAALQRLGVSPAGPPPDGDHTHVAGPAGPPPSQPPAQPPVDAPTQLPGTPSPLPPQPPQPPSAYAPPTHVSTPASTPPAGATPPPWTQPSSPQGPPPGGLYATAGLPAYAAGRPPHKRRWPLVVAAAVVVVLVVGGLSAWGLLSGRFGIGPLSGTDKTVAAVIADGVSAPSWADRSDLRCASDKLLHHSRSGTLEDRKVVKRDKQAAKGWSLTGDWDSDDAQAFTQGLLDCTDDWPAAVGKQWHLHDTGCLSDVGSSSVAGILAQSELKPVDHDLVDGNAKTADKLDDCYAKDPAAPTGKVKPGYRKVDFVLDKPHVDNGTAELSVGVKVASRTATTQTYSSETEAGGQRACVTARTVVSYGWGSSRTASRKLCGRSDPPRIWWAKESSCTEAPGCTAYELHVAGFKPFTTLKVVNMTDGNFNCGANCHKTIDIAYDGRGVGNGWYFDFTPHGTMTAKVGKYSDTLHFR